MSQLLSSPILRLPEEMPAVYWLEHWGAVRRNWKHLVCVTALGGVAGCLLALTQTPLFHAATSIEVQGITDNVLKSQDGNPNAGADAELTDLQTQIRIMQSGSLLEQVSGRVGSVFGNQRAAIERAARTLSVHVAGQTRIIEISSDSTDPRIAASFVNGVAEAFIEQHVEARWQGTQRGAEKLQRALDDMRVRLEKSEAAVQAYARDSGLVLGADRASAGEEKLHQLQAGLSQAQVDRTAKQARWNALLHGSEPELPSIVGGPVIQDAQTKLTDLRRQLADLGTTYTSDYSKVKRLQAQTAPLQLAIEREIAGAKARSQSEYAESKQHEDLLDAAYQSQLHAVQGEAEKRVHYDALRRESDAMRGLYDTMLVRVKEAAIASTMRASNVRILDRATAPVVPFQPRPLRLLFLGSLAGLFLGLGLVMAREQADTTVRVPGMLRSLLGAPELPAIPSSKREQMHREAFRSLAASLLLGEKAQAPRVLVVTSAAPGEGKTSVVAELARALAETGKRVLAVDGDMRNPSLHCAFEADTAAGLKELLAEEGACGEATVADAVQLTASVQVRLLSAGLIDAATPDLLYSPRLHQVIDYGRKNFDIVLIDSPPMGEMPDARVLARSADAVLLVVRAGKTRSDAAIAVRQRLAEDQTAMLGCILNAWNPKHSRARYGYASTAKVRNGSPLWPDLLPAKQ